MLCSPSLKSLHTGDILHLLPRLFWGCVLVSVHGWSAGARSLCPVPGSSCGLSPRHPESVALVGLPPFPAVPPCFRNLCCLGSCPRYTTCTHILHQGLLLGAPQTAELRLTLNPLLLLVVVGLQKLVRSRPEPSQDLGLWPRCVISVWPGIAFRRLLAGCVFLHARP